MLSFKGDILVGLKFVPPDMTVIKKGKRSRGALHVLIKEAKALTAVKANGTSDPFCKRYEKILVGVITSSTKKYLFITNIMIMYYNKFSVFLSVTSCPIKAAVQNRKHR